MSRPFVFDARISREQSPVTNEQTDVALPSVSDLLVSIGHAIRLEVLYSEISDSSVTRPLFVVRVFVYEPK